VPKNNMAAHIGSAQMAPRTNVRTLAAADISFSFDKVPVIVDIIFSPFLNDFGVIYF
jgi:hypothetical protein